MPTATDRGLISALFDSSATDRGNAAMQGFTDSATPAGESFDASLYTTGGVISSGPADDRFGNGVVVGIPAAVNALYGAQLGGATVYYRKRARDASCGTVTYVYWTTTDPLGTYPDPEPCGGPLVDEVIMEVFQQ